MRTARLSIDVTVIASEVERFDRLSRVWWDRHGPLRPLHVVNDLRFDYIGTLLAAHFSRPTVDPMRGLNVLDVGCGGGLLSERMAAAGARVVGIDASPGNVDAARRHARETGVSVDYRRGEPAEALRATERFDVVLALEVVEHVSDVREFVAAVGERVAPGGLLVFSTINRTLKSWLFAIFGAEFVFRLLPRGTHQWSRFVRPAELAASVESEGFGLTDLRGMGYLPIVHRASWQTSTAVNYIAAFSRNPGRASRARSLHGSG